MRNAAATAACAESHRTDDQDMNTSRIHADGSPCLEGTGSVPKDFVACCADVEARTTACVFDLRFEFWPRKNAWFIPLDPEVGGGGIEIAFCPHCGTRLGSIGAS